MLIVIPGMVAVFAVSITARLATLAAAGIITKIGTYYSVSHKIKLAISETFIFVSRYGDVTKC